MKQHHATARSLNARLTAMRMLHDGWAGPRTLAPTPAALQRTQRLGAYLLERDLAIPDPALSADGDLILEFSCDNTPNKRTVVLIRANGTATTYELTPEPATQQTRALCNTPDSGVYSYLSRG